MRKNGFTLIELLVVIAIIAVLVSVAFPVFNTVQERARAAQDMSNLRQIGLATQMYMNDNDGTIFSTSTSWMSQLEPKYVPAWKIFESPFDKRSPSEVGDSTTPISYGLNGNRNTSVQGTSIAGLLSDKITNPSAFILFAPAQKNGTTVAFAGTAGSSTVTVLRSQSTPGLLATGGTHSGRTRINAVFADMHTETLTWTKFTNPSTTDTSDPDCKYRWDP